MLGKILKLSKGRWFYGVELVIDILIIAVSYYIGYRWQRPELFPKQIDDVLLAVSYLSMSALIIFLIFKTYKCGKITYVKSMFQLMIALLLIAFSGIIIDFAIKGIGVWRRTIFYAVIIQIPIFSVYKYFLTRIHGFIVKPRNCIIIGADMDNACEVALKLIDTHNHLYNVRFMVKQDKTDILELINADIQVFISSTCDQDIKSKLIEYCAVHYIDCGIIPSFNDIIINSGKVSNMSDILFLNMIVKMDIESKLAKRIIDLLLSTIGLIITLPFTIIVALVIYLQDKGNPFYTQTRLSRNNREFTIYKFRTMVINAEEHTGATLAARNDKRITKFGKFLRASRIDELPQLFNVLKGDMSIVGPRPERPQLAEETIKTIPEFEYRTLVKPGLTGYAQVNGRYDTSFKDKLLFDLYYVNNYTLMLDFRIMFRTIRVLFTPSVTQGVANYEDVNIDAEFSKRNYSLDMLEDIIVCTRKL